MAARFFLDTYAIVEYLSGNPKFAPYIDGGDWTTSILELIETYYVALRDSSEDYADKAFLAFRQNLSEITDADVKEGMLIRLRSKARRLDLSYADAVGYAMARRTRSRFLTGDRVFSGLPDVEFLR